MRNTVEDPQAAWEKFKAHIQHETNAARRAASGKVGDSSILTVGCVDPLTKNYAWNPPGGGLFLFYEGLLPRFFEVRQGKSGVLGVHTNCGYLRVIQGFDTLTQHSQAIDQFRQYIVNMNTRYGTQFSVVSESMGSASPYTRK